MAHRPSQAIRLGFATPLYMAKRACSYAMATSPRSPTLFARYAGTGYNSRDLDTRRAKGLSQHSAGDKTAWLHVSAGIGTSPYAPIRFACPPEATLLTLTGKSRSTSAASSRHNQARSAAPRSARLSEAL